MYVIQSLLTLTHILQQCFQICNSKMRVRPYVLVDVRPTDAFKHSHLITAASCPAAKLSRAMAAECKALTAARNHPAAVIVLYDESEDTAGEVAATLEFRGYSNVFVLSGGFALARDKIGGPLVTAATTQDSEVAAIGIEEADALRNRLAATVLPPLTMAAANEWWVAACGEGVASCGGGGGGGQTQPPQPSTAATTSRSVVAKVKPWR